MRRALPWVLGAALVLGAGLVTAATPSDEDIVGPITLHGQAGDAVASRTIIATVTDAHFADEVTEETSRWSADANWLVITLDVSAATTEVDAAVQLATLAVDGRVFQASERPSASLGGTALRVGTDITGVLAFELPSDLDSGSAELRLTPTYSTPELDDLVAISVELADLPRVPSTELPAPDWSAE